MNLTEWKKYININTTALTKNWISFNTNLCWILPFFQEIFFGFGKKLLHCEEANKYISNKVFDMYT